MLEGPTASHYSKVYGVNERSCLLDVKFFSLFDGGLPHDAMHDILEGIAPLEIKKLLVHCIRSNKWFTLDEFNKTLLGFNYGYSDNDKPTPIISTVLYADDKKLKSSASQMLLLLRILPFLIGDRIPENDECWKCFILLRKIIDIVLSAIVSDSLCSSLKLLVNEHHAAFVKLYGSESYIPKMHFLVHYPEQMKSVGPLVRTWTM